MATGVETLSAWTAAKQAQVLAMKAATTILRDAEYSDDPESPYQQAQSAAQTLADAGKRLAVLGLKNIDAAIAAGGVVAEIEAAATDAKQEAALLANAAVKVTKLAKVVTAVSQVVGKIGALPFV